MHLVTNGQHGAAGRIAHSFTVHLPPPAPSGVTTNHQLIIIPHFHYSTVDSGPAEGGPRSTESVGAKEGARHPVSHIDERINNEIDFRPRTNSTGSTSFNCGRTGVSDENLWKVTRATSCLAKCRPMAKVIPRLSLLINHHEERKTFV